jgi:hypothetical protein
VILRTAHAASSRIAATTALISPNSALKISSTRVHPVSRRSAGSRPETSSGIEHRLDLSPDDAADIVSGRGRCTGCGLPITPVNL